MAKGLRPLIEFRKRKTIRLFDTTLDAAREIAKRGGVTLNEVIEAGLRRIFQEVREELGRQELVSDEL